MFCCKGLLSCSPVQTLSELIVQCCYLFSGSIFVYTRVYTHVYMQVTALEKSVGGKLFESLDALKWYNLLLSFLENWAENWILGWKLFCLKMLKIVFHLFLHPYVPARRDWRETPLSFVSWWVRELGYLVTQSLSVNSLTLPACPVGRWNMPHGQKCSRWREKESVFYTTS